MFQLPDRYPLLTGTISRGLELLQTVFTVSNQEDLVSVMQQQITTLPPPLLGHDDIQVWENKRRQRQDRRYPKRFERDIEPDESGSRPSLGFMLLWRQTRNTLNKIIFAGRVSHLWGYIMWDAARLEQSGGDKQIISDVNVAMGVDGPV